MCFYYFALHAAVSASRLKTIPVWTLFHNDNGKKRKIAFASMVKEDFENVRRRRL